MPRYLNALSDLETYLSETGFTLRVVHDADGWMATLESSTASFSGFGATMLEAVRDTIAGASR